MNTPPRSIRVGVNGRTFVEDEPGGAVQTAKELTRGLIGTDGVDVTVFGHKSLEAEFDAPVRGDLYWEVSPYYGVIWERAILPILAKRCEIDVLFCPNGNGPLHRTSFPVVTCIHDVSAQDDWSATMHGLYRKVTIPRVARVSDHLVTVSKFSKSEINSKFDVDPSRITVIHNGISEWFLSDKPGTPVDVPEEYILYVGALNPRKNVNGLVQAYRRISDQLSHDLVLTGPRNKEIFKSLEVTEADDIHLTGFVSQSELKFLYKQADVFAYPSFYEGFGLPPLEAAACGTPVVASRTGAIPDILDDAARYVDPDDVKDIGSGLLWAASDPAVEKHVTNAQERVQSVTWERATEELHSTLTSIVKPTDD